MSQLGTGHAPGEPEIVPDERAGSRLAPERLRLDDQRPQSFGRAVHPSGQPSRTRPEDCEIVDRLGRPGGDSV